MELDKLVIQRFDELLRKADEVESTRESAGPNAHINHEAFEEWSTSAMSLLNRVFGESSVHYQNFNRHYSAFQGWIRIFSKCRGAFKAAKDDYEGGYLFNLKSLVSAEVLDNVLEQAKELLNAGYKDPACVVTGVTLETALKDLCNRKSIPLGKLDKMNADLAKAGVYNSVKQKQITAWADLRNKAAHGDWSQYNNKDVDDMINGVNRFIADYL